MKRFYIWTLILASVTNLISQDNKFVLVIGIDGCRPDALELADTPNLDQLAEDGLYSPNALNGDNTISGPGWSAILCGVRSDKHMVTNNDFSNNNYAEYPSIFKHIKDERPDYQLVSFCHWSPINDHIIGDDADFKLNFSSDEELANTAADYLKINDPKVTFIHFDEVDGAGHGFGFSPEVEEYVNTIERIDEYVGILLDAIRSRPNYDNEDWLILSTSDHGGEGFGHGGTTIPHREVYMIASGKNIPQQIITPDTSYQVEENNHCLNDSISLSFQNNDAQVQAQSPLFNFGSDQDFTIEIRVKTDVTADVSIIGNKDWNSGSNPGFVFSFKYPSGPEWKMNIGDGNNRVDIENGGLIADGEWHMLSVSFDRDGMARMYEDGEFVSEADISNIGDIDTDGGIYIGSDINQAYDYNGNVSEIRVWEGVASDETINSLHCSSIETDHPLYDKLLSYWRFNNETNGLVDLSINQINPTAVLTTWDSTDTTEIVRYLNTPKLVDVPPTILDHLCIDNNIMWELEGKSLIEENCISSVGGVFDSGLIISPNPFNDVIHITSNDDEKKTLILFDQSGRVLLNRTMNKTAKFDLSHLPPSSYYIKLTSKENSTQKTYKIIKLN